MIGRFVKSNVLALNILNARLFTVLLFIAGIIAAVILFPNLAADGSVTKKELTGIALLLFIPYLIVKAFVLIILLILDVSINFSAQTTNTYKLSFEKAKAHIAKIFLDKGIQFTKVDNFELGIEKYLVTVMQKYIAGSKFNYPANMISGRPFVVARTYDLKDGNIQLKVLYEEQKEAEVIGRLIAASLQALEKEEQEKNPGPSMTISAGSIKIADEKKQDAKLELTIPKKIEENAPSENPADKAGLKK